MAKSKNSFITAELDWAEAQIKTWKDYIDANPFAELQDRQKGKTVITKEQQGKFLMEAMKNYLSLLEVVDKLRSHEEQKQIKVRGEEELTPFENGAI